MFVVLVSAVVIMRLQIRVTKYRNKEEKMELGEAESTDSEEDDVV